MRTAACAVVAVMAALLARDASPQEEKKPRVFNVGGLDAPAATIKGVVKFKGEQPRRAPIKMTAAQGCVDCWAGKPVPLSEEWIYGKNGDDATLQNVLVYITKGLGAKKFEPPRERVIVDQVNCIYVPRVVGIMVGQTLEVRSSDSMLHNVRCQPNNNQGFNNGVNKFGVFDHVFTQPELRVELRCNMHTWMKGLVHVLDHPFYAVTQADGTYTLKGLPAGTYEVSVVHEATRFAPDTRSVTVKVGDGETKTVDFAYEDKQKE